MDDDNMFLKLAIDAFNIYEFHIMVHAMFAGYDDWDIEQIGIGIHTGNVYSLDIE